jgi:hypothetical protein
MLHASATASWMGGLSEQAGDTVSTKGSQAPSPGFSFHFFTLQIKPKCKSVSKMEKKKSKEK